MSDRRQQPSRRTFRDHRTTITLAEAGDIARMALVLGEERERLRREWEDGCSIEQAVDPADTQKAEPGGFPGSTTEGAP